MFRGATSAAVAPAGAMAGGEAAGRSVVSRTTFIAIIIALIIFVVVAILLAVALATILLVSPSNQSSSGTNTTETAGTASDGYGDCQPALCSISNTCIWNTYLKYTDVFEIRLYYCSLYLYLKYILIVFCIFIQLTHRKIYCKNTLFVCRLCNIGMKWICKRERERERDNLFAKIINNNIITQWEVQWQVARGSINSISAGHLCQYN